MRATDPDAVALRQEQEQSLIDGPPRWVLAPHICRVCFGRVLQLSTFDRRRKVYRCSNCETELEGEGAQVLCCCGIKLRNGRDAGIRCIENPRRTPENPARVVAEQISTQTPPR